MTQNVMTALVLHACRLRVKTRDNPKGCCLVFASVGLDISILRPYMFIKLGPKIVSVLL